MFGSTCSCKQETCYNAGMWSAHKERTANELVLCNMLTESLGIIIVWYSFTQFKIYSFRV